MSALRTKDTYRKKKGLKGGIKTTITKKKPTGKF